MDSLILLLVPVMLIVGLAIGWIARAGAIAEAKRDRDALDARLRDAEQRLATAEERAGHLPPLRLLLDAVTLERDAAQRDLSAARTVASRAEMLDQALATERARAEALAAEKAAFVRGEAERGDAHAAQLAQLREMEAKLTTQFGELAARALGDAQTSFLKRADERFKQSEETAGQGLKALLQPVHDRLLRYEETVTKVESERRDAFGMLQGQIESMRIGQEKVSSEAAKLVNSLRNAPKSRGRWGEQQLKNVLETCGLHEHTDYQTEVSIGAGDEGGRLRPDAIVRVPGGRALVIDAKVSLNAYQDAFGAVDDAERLIGLAAHANSMRTHVNGLGNKAYWSQFDDAPDYVIMFVPGEHFLSAALEHDPTLWDFAFDKRVLLATPTNLIAIARTVAAVWRQEKLAKEAKAIGDLGKEMYERLVVSAGHLRKVGSGLTSAVNNYNAFVGSYERNLMSTGRKFKALNIETSGKELEDVPAVEALARHGEPERLAAPAASD